MTLIELNQNFIQFRAKFNEIKEYFFSIHLRNNIESSLQIALNLNKIFVWGNQTIFSSLFSPSKRIFCSIGYLNIQEEPNNMTPLFSISSKNSNLSRLHYNPIGNLRFITWNFTLLQKLMLRGK